MLGVLILAAFEACGVAQAIKLFNRRGMLTRVWLGMVLGLMEMMWFPSLFAYLYDFTLPAQQLALAASALVTVACACLPGGRADERSLRGEPPAPLCALLVIPAAIIAGYLQYTHNLREIDGALYVGQSTYGDLCMHLSFATGLVGQSYPPEYTLLPGTQLGYPFLVDALSATMLIFGTPLSAAFAIPGALMTALIYMGFVMFAWEMTNRRGATVVSFLLLFFNGGLGFLYVLDRVGADPGMLTDALTGYYRAPANMPEYNLRWVNALCDLIVPQRTLMAGWMCALPALYLLASGIRTRRTGTFLALGLWAGAMPMIHTHSFLALGIISFGAMADCLIRDRSHRRKMLLNFALYGVTACLLAFPQLLEWTFPQTLNGGSLRVLFNWVNNDGTGALIDGYFWFWVKNVGLVYLFFPIAALSVRKRRAKAISLGAFMLYAAAEFFVFQPNVYDNSKLFFVAFIAMLPTCAELLVALYARLRGLRGRAVLAAAFMAASMLSGGISIARECVSQYQIFGVGQVEAAKYILENTPKDALFLTANQHNNAVASLAGRKIVCGSNLYLYFHGLDSSQREADAVLMLALPDQYSCLYEEYGVDYVYVSSFERQTFFINGMLVPNAEDRRDSYAIDEDAIGEKYPLVYEGGDWYDQIRIYAVSARAQAAYARQMRENE